MTTTEDLLNLSGIGQRASGFRFDVLDHALNKIEELEQVEQQSPPSVSMDTTSTTMRRLSNLRLSPGVGADFEPRRKLIRPVMILENGEERPLGVFVFVDGRRVRDRYGVSYTGTLLDRSFIVDQQLKQTYGLDTGAVIAPAIEDLLSAVGIYNARVDATGAVIGDPIVWPSGRSRLQAVNELAALNGCYPLHFGHDGRPLVIAVPDLNTVEPAVTYADGLNIMDVGIDETDNLLSAPNVWVCEDTGATTGPIRGEYALSPAAPNSAHNTGIEIPVCFTDQGLTSSLQAEQRARVRAAVESQTDLIVSFSGAPDPRHGTFDVVDFRGVRYQETSWSMTLQEGEAMRHTLRRSFE